MLLKTILIIATVFCTPLNAFSDDVCEKLHALEKQLDRIQTLTANFTQKNPDGTIFKGKLFLKRPGYIKFLYESPADMVILSNREHLIYFDPSTKQTSYLSLENSPAQLLLEASLNFKKHATLVSFEEMACHTKIILKTHKTRQFITLFIDPAEKEITGWVTKDPQGNEIVLEFSDIVKNPNLCDPELFVFKKPKRTKKK
jgi:outer membrane lipoprotein-sorting protein